MLVHIYSPFFAVSPRVRVRVERFVFPLYSRGAIAKARRKASELAELLPLAGYKVRCNDLESIQSVLCLHVKFVAINWVDFIECLHC